MEEQKKVTENTNKQNTKKKKPQQNNNVVIDNKQKDSKHYENQNNNKKKNPSHNTPTNKENKNVKKNNNPKPQKQENKKDKEPKKLFSGDVKVYSLGGVGVVGMNIYVIEQGNEILIMDAGILFADDDTHGVNYIIPDFSYLKQNESKIVGLFITHGHEDHIGSIPFLLKDVKVPKIYASGLAVGLIKNKLAEFPEIVYHLEEYYDDSIITTKNFKVSFFRTNHSIPDSFGIAVKTNLGYIVNTGDFKFDLSPVGKPSDFYKMAKLGEEGVYCLLAESTNANITTLSTSEKKIGENLLQLFEKIEGRIIVATFASNVYRVQQIIEASVKTGRKVLVFGHSMETTIEVATKLKYINTPKDWIIRSRDIKRADDGKYTILCTGSQGEPMAALSRISQGTHKQIKLEPTDTIIYSSKPIPGNEQFVNRNINRLVRSGCKVIVNSSLTDTHTTGHASENELKLMLSLMKPKYFIPVHGEYAMLKRHVELAELQGVKKENCFILSPGDVVSLSKTQAKLLSHAVPASDIFLDNSLSDVDSFVLKDRKLMADDGIIAVAYYVNKKGQLINDPIVALKGFAVADAEVELKERIKNKAIDIYEASLKNAQKLKTQSKEKQLANQLSQFIYYKIERHPLVVCSIIE